MEVDKKKIEGQDLKDKRVLARVDLNVPLDENQKITDETRLVACMPTLKYILDNGGSVVIMAHLGRPKGVFNEKLSLKHIVKRLSELLGREVRLAPDCIGAEVGNLKENLKPGEVLLLENVRFHPEEEAKEPNEAFCKDLASHADLYVNDSFSSSHRAHASTAHVTQHFPGKALMGFGLAEEERYLKKALLSPDRPFMAIVGGSKISSKIGVLKKLVEKADALLIGGAMAHTFLTAKGIAVGKSLNEPDFVQDAKEIIEKCAQRGISLILPKDLVMAPDPASEDKAQVYPIDSLPQDLTGLDVGPKTLDTYKECLKSAKTVFWNGPLGMTEVPAFSMGTEALAKLLGGLDATKIVGGGDSVAALKKLGLCSEMTYISTGGGASLEYIEKGALPGIDALSNN